MKDDWGYKSIPGRIVRSGKSHKHRLDTKLDGTGVYVIICKRWGCDYREVDPNSLEAAEDRAKMALNSNGPLMVLEGKDFEGDTEIFIGAPLKVKVQSIEDDTAYLTTYQEIIDRAQESPDFREGLLVAARIAEAQGRGLYPCPSDMAAVYIRRVANGEMP